MAKTAHELTVKIVFTSDFAGKRNAANALQLLLKKILYDAGEIQSVDVQGRL